MLSVMLHTSLKYCKANNTTETIRTTGTKLANMKMHQPKGSVFKVDYLTSGGQTGGQTMEAQDLNKM